RIAALLPAAPSRLYVGFSGGLDSTVLLHATARLAAQGRCPQPIAVHVHHGLQTEADVWLSHCESVSGELGVEFLARRVAVASGSSVESSARAARYAVFRALLEESVDCLLLAHHRDDQVETLLMRTLQGRGPYGMPAQRRLAGGVVLRPWLDVARSALERYADQHGLVWVEDPSNLIVDADRNFLRREVLPRLRARFPQTDRALLALADARGGNRGGTSVAESLALGELEDASVMARAARLRQWLLDLGLTLPRARALCVFIEQLDAGADRQPVLRLQAGELRRYRDRVWFVPPRMNLAAEYSLPTRGRLELPHGVLEMRSDPAGYIGHPPYSIVFRKGGEVLEVNGVRRALKTLLQQAAVAPWARDRLPLVHDARGLWCVPGVAVRDLHPGEEGERVRVDWHPRAPTRV
ncbi:MAG: tRNA lysidine(34) synthetase TilS, partial [Pseudomonadales bacterium]